MGSAIEAPDSTAEFGRLSLARGMGPAVARWDEKAALSSPQLVYGLHTDSKSKGESGHEGR